MAETFAPPFHRAIVLSITTVNYVILARAIWSIIYIERMGTYVYVTTLHLPWTLLQTSSMSFGSNRYIHTALYSIQHLCTCIRRHWRNTQNQLYVCTYHIYVSYMVVREVRAYKPKHSKTCLRTYLQLQLFTPFCQFMVSFLLIVYFSLHKQYK